MSSQYDQFLYDHCCLSSQFLITCPQPRIPLYCQNERRKFDRNTNAFESSYSSESIEYKAKNLLHPYRIPDEHHYVNKEDSTKRDMKSANKEVKCYMFNRSKVSIENISSSERADGDKNNDETSRHNSFDNFQHEQFYKNHRKEMQRSPISCDSNDLKPVKKIPICQIQVPSNVYSSSKNHLSKMPVNRTSTWRKLQANISSTHYDTIQKYQIERQRNSSPSVSRPIMISPVNNESDVSSTINSLTSTSLNSNFVDDNIESVKLDKSIRTDDENSNATIPMTNPLTTAHFKQTYSVDNKTAENSDSMPNSKNENSFCVSTSTTVPNGSVVNIIERNTLNIQPVSSSSLNEVESIEEIQPIIEISSPQTPNLLIDNILSTFFSTGPTTDMPELIIFTPPELSFDNQDFILESHSTTENPSLSRSIEELCILIRKLLQYELANQRVTSLQTTISNQLAILLTYLAIPNQTRDKVDKMTSTDECNSFYREPTEFSTIGSQTGDFEVHPLSSFNKCQDTTTNISTSFELLSTNATFQLPGHRINHVLSDTFIHQIHRQQQHSSSQHTFISFSDTNLQVLRHNRSTRNENKHLFQRSGHKFRNLIELVSSNTYLEASTEFTPDFLLPTTNNSKYDIDYDDDDQTEQFGINTKQHDQCDTFTFNSFDQEDHENLGIENPDYTTMRRFSNTNNLIPHVIKKFTKKSYYCELLEPLINTCQWRVPVLPHRKSSMDMIYVRQTAKINLNNRKHIIGKRVRIKSKKSLQMLTPTRKNNHFNQNLFCEDTSTFHNDDNKNHFCEQAKSIDSSTSIDSLNCSDHCAILPTYLQLLDNNSKSNYCLLKK